MAVNWIKSIDMLEVDYGIKIPDGMSIATANGILTAWSNKNLGSTKIFKVIDKERYIVWIR